MSANKHKGSTLDSFLEEGLLDDAEAIAIKRVIAYEFAKKIKKAHLSKTEIAAKMGTSRSALDRLLDPANTSVTLNTLVKAAHFIGKKLHVTVVNK
jgi:predicted XRE-type DNA-binding protein